jgi:uncharacterized protein YjbJ (UPF0337 family)
MHDDQRATPREMAGRVEETFGEAVGNANVAADGRYNQIAGRVQRAVAHAHDAVDQFSGIVRARPLASAAIAIGLGYLFGRRR